ncbi:hypothetical protein H920_18748 [Fukomys damarensis]|uniref:Uncharacterized protein n=1 Tax=Fukomys damarensis TaxID=885580 RepID=A0A091DAQ6_FUKDA|nr:hypothetical protein H920_18748 [Fukomys damarensis]
MEVQVLQVEGFGKHPQLLAETPEEHFRVETTASTHRENGLKLWAYCAVVLGTQDEVRRVQVPYRIIQAPEIPKDNSVATLCENREAQHPKTSHQRASKSKVTAATSLRSQKKMHNRAKFEDTAEPIADVPQIPKSQCAVINTASPPRESSKATEIVTSVALFSHNHGRHQSSSHFSGSLTELSVAMTAVAGLDALPLLLQTSALDTRGSKHGSIPKSSIL